MSNTQDNENPQLSLFPFWESTSSPSEAESQHELKESFSIIDDEERRSNIERIIKSYRYPWDVYAELIQNSLDAIFDAKKQLHSNSPRWKGKIEITVEPEKRRLVIEDNGIGIPPEKIGQVIVFGKSLKRTEQQSRHGFMGYGLTFVAFQSSFINLESSYIVDIHKNQGRKSQRTYLNLYTYVFKKEELPDAEAKPAPENTRIHGTKIEIHFPNDRDAFSDRQLDIDRMFNYANNLNLFEYLLRTKTAIGNTDKLFDNQPMCDIEIVINCNCNSLKIPFKFLGLTEVLQKVGINEDRCKSLSDFLKLLELTESEPKQEKDRRRIVQAIRYANETELIGNESLLGYTLKKLSTYDQYDGLFEYRLSYSEYSSNKSDNEPLGITEETFFDFQNEEIYYDDLIVEFKHKLDSIYDDIRDKKKDMRDIDLLVCWEMDFNRIKDQGDELTEIDQERRFLDGVTHELDSLDANKKIPVICLKTFLEKTKGLSFEQ
jgi:hypothetical protein